MPSVNQMGAEAKRLGAGRLMVLTDPGVAKAGLLDPVKTDSVSVTGAAMIIGGGLAGITAALSLADQGFQVHIVEREKDLGGLVAG